MWCLSVAAQGTGVTVSYSLGSQTVTLGEPVFLRFEVQNGSREAIKVDLGQNRKQAFLFDVTFPNGTTVTQLSMPTRQGISPIGRISVGVGETYKQTLLLYEWVDLSQVGTYQIDVKLASSIESVTGVRIAAPAFRTVFNILPRDEFVLREVCDKLLSRIEGSQSVEEAMEAALALSHVRDSIAVPFLDRALRSGKQVANEAVSGLERIGDMSAVQVLISFVRETDATPIDINTYAGTREILARSALERIQRRTSDLAIKQAIQSALGPAGDVQAR
jgi:hypothetical protein